MGRGRITAEPLDPAVVQASFRVRQDGQIVRASTGEVATFVGPGGRLLVRVYHAGTIRRIVASRLAWCLSCGSWPKGVVRARNGVDDLRFENLIVVKRGPRPFDQSKGGKRSALHERQASDAALLRTLAEHQGALTVPQLSQSLGQSAPCCCVRLARLERSGLVCGPRCNAAERWRLLEAGKALATTPNPVVIDDTDRRLLGALILKPLRQLELARAAQVCSLTAKRRTGLMIGRGLIRIEDGKFTITSKGRDLLGPDAPKRWIDLDRVRASTAKDVSRRMEHPNDDRSSWERAQQATLAREKAAETMRLRKQQPFINAYTEWSRTG